MTDELRALMLLYRKSRETQQKASQDRTDAQSKLRDSVSAERKSGVLLEQLQPLIHSLLGGAEALQEADKELAAAKQKAEEKAEGKGQARAESKAEGRAEGRAESKAESKAPEAQPAGKSK